MLVIAALGALASGLAAVLMFALGGYFDDPAGSRGRLFVVLLIAAWPLTFVGVFFNVALAAAADAALDGRHLTLRQALGVSMASSGRSPSGHCSRRASA